MLKAGLIIASLLATGALAQDHWNWGTSNDEWSNDADFAGSKAICRRLGHPVAPRSDQPSTAQKESLKNCSSEALYYAPGGKPDYVKARLCAMTEGRQRNPGDVLRGTAILMQVYANGRGVPRDLDLATAYACELDEAAAAESDARVRHLQSLKTKPEADPFDYCEDVTSGVHESICIGRQSEAKAVARNARMKALTDRLSPADAAQYRAMFKAFDAFVEARGDGEMDHGGTAHAGIEIMEEDAIRDQFVVDLARLLDGTWPLATSTQAKAADARLNLSYREALAVVGEDDQQAASVPTMASVRETQRAWLAYRDAYLRFAAVAVPGLSSDSVLARLTKLRTAQLDQF